VTPHCYRLELVDEAEGDADERMVETIAWLQSRGYKVEHASDLATRLRRRERDGFLLQALELMSAGTPGGRCVELEAEIRRFEAVLWPRWRDREMPPEGGSALRSCLFRARRLGPLPTTARHLWNIAMKRNSPCDFREKPFSSAPDPERGHSIS
jgi:hypothetical protein